MDTLVQVLLWLGIVWIILIIISIILGFVGFVVVLVKTIKEPHPNHALRNQTRRQRPPGQSGQARGRY